MSGKIGIGILSFAHGHANIYCQRMAQFDDVRLVSCWDDDIERGKKSAETFNMHFSPHLDDVINSPDIQAVIVTCETNRHPELVIAAAQAKKHILCQKPMALTLPDCDRIIQVVRQSGILFMMAYQMRHDPSNQKIKELVENNSIGRVGLLRRRHCIPLLFDENFSKDSSQWHVDPIKNMGMFMDDASHAADFIYWILGRPSSVIAEIDNILTHVAPDDTGVAVYRFPSGSMAVLVNSSVTLAGENTTEVYGDQGVIIQNYDDLVSTNVKPPPGAMALKLYQRGGSGWKDLGVPIPVSHSERIAAVPRPFIDCLLYERPSPITAEDGRVSVEMVLGAYQSAREGKRISFPI